MALRQQFTNPRDGVFSRVLGDAEIAALVTAHVKDYRERIYPPLDTLSVDKHLMIVTDQEGIGRAHQDQSDRRR
ncbi:MAG: hypothetical protein GYA73_07100, partial [Planctomycetes bacterium]|nr:hypothetical protein [Planctomycetota bacterium]